jgi:hypothetical protein
VGFRTVLVLLTSPGLLLALAWERLRAALAGSGAKGGR